MVKLYNTHLHKNYISSSSSGGSSFKSIFSLLPLPTLREDEGCSEKLWNVGIDWCTGGGWGDWL